MRVLMIGDIVGRGGRKALRIFLPKLRDELQPHIIVANGENAAGGFGLTEKVKEEIKTLGVDVITLGNHSWDNKEIYSFLEEEERVLRPANYPPRTPGRGFMELMVKGKRILFINLLGRIFMDPIDCPFRTLDRILEEYREYPPTYTIVDFHGEATSEKKAMGFYGDGRVSIVAGTHTHIQTADEEILEGGTAYITDLGMTGAVDSILGMGKDEVIQRIISHRPIRFNVAKGKVQINGLFIELEETEGRAIDIKRINLRE